MLTQSTFAMFTLERYDLQPRGTGLVLAYVGIVSVATQGYFLPRVIIGRFRPSERTMLAGGGVDLHLDAVTIVHTGSVPHCRRTHRRPPTMIWVRSRGS